MGNGEFPQVAPDVALLSRGGQVTTILRLRSGQTPPLRKNYSELMKAIRSAWSEGESALKFWITCIASPP